MFKSASLPDNILRIVKDKGTEPPLSGEYDQYDGAGTYLCRQCGLALFRSDTKFHSGCGWPSFDDNLPNAVLREPDADGRRTEILCARCRAHLGHVFQGEKMTARNLRHCVNSLSMDYVPDLTVLDTEEAIYAGGCFWGVESLIKQLPGVLKTEVGYTGGHLKYPDYHAVCRGDSGHYEAIRVIYDPAVIDYQQLTAYFFEIHNPEQLDGQGPDRGEQYRSAIFYYNDRQKQIAADLITKLENQGLKIATRLLPVSTFWRAETYHQNYYEKTGKQPYCHVYTKRFK